MNRAEHLAWCKQRALAYVDEGNNKEAFASMLSDLGKHEETAPALKSCAPMGIMLMAGGHLDTAHQMRDFINGFN